ncbi:hypothetical protein ScPMuIL_009763 [Solemya velum]
MRDDYTTASCPNVPEDEYDFTLSIKDTRVADSGEWCCEITHPNGTISSFCNVKIFESLPEDEKPPLFVKPLENIFIDDCDDIHLQCQVFGKPLPDIIWHHNGKILEKDDRHKHSCTDDGICSLTVSPFIPEADKGLYTCSASNTTGAATTEGLLKISVKSEPKPEPQISKPKTKIVKRLEKVTVKKTIYQRKLIQPKPEEEKSIILEKDHDGISEIYLREFYKNDFIDTSILKQLIGWEGEEKLYFQVHLKNKCAVDGSHAILSCMVSGILPFKIRWLKDGTELEDTEKYYVKNCGGLQSLELVEVTFNDTGQYTCEVSNKQRQITSSCYLQVEPVFDPHFEYQQPQIVRQIQNLDIGEGHEAMLVCAAKGTPMPGFKWYKDSRAMHESDRISMSFDEVGVAILCIKRLTFSDKGLYTCEAHNLAGRCKSSGTINVRESRGLPEFEDVPVEIEIEEERETEVEVAATPEPEPEPEPPKYELDALCHVKCTSIVNARGPDFTIQLPKFVEIKNGKRLFLKCHTDGYPAPEVSWLKDGKPFENNDSIFSLSMGSWHGLEVLELNHKCHSGTYTALAENGVESNRTNCVVEILVYGKSQEMHLNAEKNEIIPPSNDFEVLLPQTRLYGEALVIPALLTTGLLCHTSPLTAPDIELPPKCKESPYFTQELKSSYYPLEIDDNFTMECVVAGIPTPSVVWYHDGEVVEHTRNVRMEWDPISHRAAIVIRFMHILDTGRYQCLAYSEGGYATTTTELHMRRLDMLIERIDQVAEGDLKVRELSCPEFTGKLHDRVVMEGDLVRLECVTDGIPAPTVRWFKNDQEIHSYGNVMIRSDGPLHQLEVIDVSLTDHGCYACEATSSEGTATTRAQLTVEGAEEGEISDVEYGRPEFIETLRSLSVPAGQDAVLSGIIRGNPKAKTEMWKGTTGSTHYDYLAPLVQKDNTDLFQSDRLQTSLNKTGVLTLRIKNIQKSDAGMYICTAKNRAGRVKASATIRVTEKRRMTWSGDAFELPPSLNPILLRPRSGSMDPSGHHLGSNLFQTDSDVESKDYCDGSMDHVSMPLIEEGEEEEEEATKKAVMTKEEQATESTLGEQVVEDLKVKDDKLEEDLPAEKPLQVNGDSVDADKKIDEEVEDINNVKKAESDCQNADNNKIPEPVPEPDVIPKELPPPVFTVRPRSQWVLGDKEIKISVRVRATSKPDVKWMKDGHYVTYDGL